MVNALAIHPISVQTPIEEFTNPSSGSVIDVISTVHVGSPFYYDRLRDHLRLRAEEGFVVGEESIRETSEAEIAEAKARDKNKHKLLIIGANYAMQALISVENSPSFTSQYEFDARLAVDPLITERINMDVTDLDIARSSRYSDLARMVFSAYSLSKKLERAFEKGPEAYDQAIYDAIAKDFEASKVKQQAKPKRKDNGMLHNRNRAVLEHVDGVVTEDPEAKIALVWGYGHRRGLVDGIQQRGYRRTWVSSETVTLNPALLR